MRIKRASNVHHTQPKNFSAAEVQRSAAELVHARNRRTTGVTNMPRAAEGTTALETPRLITILEAATIARVSKPTIVRAYLAGSLRVFCTPLGGVVRIYFDSLLTWIDLNSYGARL